LGKVNVLDNNSITKNQKNLNGKNNIKTKQEQNMAKLGGYFVEQTKNNKNILKYLTLIDKVNLTKNIIKFPETEKGNTNFSEVKNIKLTKIYKKNERL
jgi:uncharacterized membrane protein